MRVVAVDYGKKRTGLAVTDPLRIVAGPLDTVPTTELFNFLNAYVAREEVERLVLGRPTQPDGTPSENLARVEAFAARWRKVHPEIPVEFFDERFTSVLAHKYIIDGGVKKKTRREDKGLVDRVSAVIILEDWMRSH